MVKNSHANAGDTRDAGSSPRKIPLEKDTAAHCGILAGESHGRRTGHKESDMTEAT